MPRGGLGRGIRSLIAFLTTIPTGVLDLDSAAGTFFAIPLVALLEGVIAFAIALAVSRVSTPLMGAVALLITHVALTRALHLDALADYADVVGSMRVGEDALRVLKDPRKGAFAIVALCLYSLLFVASATRILSMVSNPLTLLGIIESLYLWSLETMYIVAVLSPPEPYEGLGRRFVTKAKSARSIALNAALLSVSQTLCFWLAGTLSLLPITVSILVALFVARDCRKRLGFANGDVLGASNEITRVLAMSVTAVALKWI